MKTKQLLFLGGGLLTVLIAFNYKKVASTATNLFNDMTKPRGIRNNNPGNLRISSITWLHKIPAAQNTDGAFEQFETFAWGTRALIKNLKAYYDGGLKTISQVINKWAPSSENNTTAYISAVASQSDLDPDTVFDWNQNNLYNISKAIGLHENGVDCINPEIFNQAWALL